MKTGKNLLTVKIFLCVTPLSTLFIYVKSIDNDVTNRKIFTISYSNVLPIFVFLNMANLLLTNYHNGHKPKTM